MSVKSKLEDIMSYVSLADTLLDDLVDDIGVEPTIRLLIDKGFDPDFIEFELGFECESINKVLEQMGQELHEQQEQH